MSESYILRHADSCQLMKTQLGTTAELPKCSCGLFAFLRSIEADKKKIEELEESLAFSIDDTARCRKRIEELEAWKLWATEFVILQSNCPDCMKANYDCICDAALKGEKR